MFSAIVLAALIGTLQSLPDDTWAAWTIQSPRHSRATVIAVRMHGGTISELEMSDWRCDFQERLASYRKVENVTTEESLAFFRSQLGRARRDEQVIAAIAMHDHPSVVPELIRFARNDERREVRRSALFWLGQHAGEKAAAELRQAVDDDPDDDVRQHAVFAISQLPTERSVPMLIDLVKTHKSPKIRKRAMFWLAQSEDPRALDLIEGILAR